MRWLCWWRPPSLCKRVIVNFTHDPTEAIEGVLWSYWWGWLTLKDCTPLKAGRQVQAEKLPGDIVIHRDQIAFWQVTP